MWQNLHYNLFFGKCFLLGCNHSLANSLLHHELKCLDWVGLWWWWFGVVWIILIFIMRIDWCGYSLVSNPFAARWFAICLSSFGSVGLCKGVCILSSWILRIATNRTRIPSDCRERWNTLSSAHGLPISVCKGHVPLFWREWSNNEVWLDQMAAFESLFVYVVV